MLVIEGLNSSFLTPRYRYEGVKSEERWLVVITKIFICVIAGWFLF